MHTISRRSVLKSGAALVATLSAPAIVRAATKDIVIGGPAGAAKYFNADLFPVLEKKLDCKVLYEGTNSLTNLQKMQADKAAPKISVVIMDDPVMLPAVAEGLITKMSPASIRESSKRSTNPERRAFTAPTRTGWSTTTSPRSSRVRIRTTTGR